MRSKCRDCGGELGEQKKSKRPDVCDSCWQTRLDLVSGRIPATKDQLQGVQRSMAGGRGTAKRRIDALRGDDRTDYGGVLGADGQVYSDADPGL
jgi:hypothetical protein